MASINRTYKTFNRAASEPKSVDRLAKTLIGIWNDVRHRYLFKFSPYQVYLCILLTHIYILYTFILLQIVRVCTYIHYILFVIYFNYTYVSYNQYILLLVYIINEVGSVAVSVGS